LTAIGTEGNLGAMTKPYSAALAAQLDMLRARIAAGMPRRGWKVGINVPEVQTALGIPHALVGWLDGDRVSTSGSTFPATPGSRLHVEPELCLRLAAPVAASADKAEARAAIEAIAPALEIVDYAKPATGLNDIVQHSMFHAGWVLGAWQPVKLQDATDIAGEVRLRVGAREAEPARSDLVPLDLAEIVLLVARALAEFGEGIVAGDVILSGSFTARALPMNPGETAIAALGPFGTVSCTAAG
jgi:2-keto-4-pentenoate hydratase